MNGEMTLNVDDLFRLPDMSIVKRSWPDSSVDYPDIYQKRGGWWRELTDRSDGLLLATDVIWSDFAAFTIIHVETQGMQ